VRGTAQPFEKVPARILLFIFFMPGGDWPATLSMGLKKIPPHTWLSDSGENFSLFAKERRWH
jgi:hypothetical protein